MKRILLVTAVLILALSTTIAYADVVDPWHQPLRLARPTSISSDGRASIWITYENGGVTGVDILRIAGAPTYPAYRIDFDYNDHVIAPHPFANWGTPPPSITIMVTYEDGTQEKWTLGSGGLEKILAAVNRGALSLDVKEVLSGFGCIPTKMPPYPFTNELQNLQSDYAALLQEVNAEFDEQTAELTAALATLNTEKQEAIDAVKASFAEEKAALEAERSGLKTTQNAKLAAAKTEFMTKLKNTIKSGKWTDIIGVIKEYMAKRNAVNAETKTRSAEIDKLLAGLGVEQKNAIAALEEQYKTEIAELEKTLAGLTGGKQNAIDALKAAAKEEIQALCEKYGVAYQDQYLQKIFGYEFWGWADWGLKKGPANLDSTLYQLTQADNPADWAKTHLIELVNGSVRVIIEMGEGATVPEGITVETSYQNLVQALIPINDILKVAAAPGVRLVRTPAYSFVDLGRLNTLPVTKNNAVNGISFISQMAGGEQEQQLKYYQ